MAAEFSIGPDKKFYLGEDKVVRTPVYGPDGVTPVDVSGWSLSYMVKKVAKAATPLIAKSVDEGIEIEGVYNVDPSTNTQRVVITFTSGDTQSLKPAFAYRHTLKRVDEGNEGVLFDGSITFLQGATPV